MLGMRRTGPIGLDFGTEKLKLVQADFTKDGPCIRSAVSLSYPTGKEQFFSSTADLKAVLKEARQQGNFKGSRATVSMPPDKVQFVSLEYKYRSGQDEDEAVIEAIRERFGDRIGSSVIDYLQIRPDHKEQADRTALVAVADRNNVVAFLEFLRKGGLIVDRLEIGPVAINRLISAMHPTENDKICLVINFGLHKSYATVLWGRRLLLDRALSFGSQTGIEQIAEALEINHDEAGELLQRHGVQIVHKLAVGMDFSEPGIEETITDIMKPSLLKLASEIKRLMLYVASRTRGRNVHQAYLFGSVADWPGIETMLSDMTGLPLRVSRPFYGLKTSHQATRIEDLSTLRGSAVATGLALLGSEHDA